MNRTGKSSVLVAAGSSLFWLASGGGAAGKKKLGFSGSGFKRSHLGDIKIDATMAAHHAKKSLNFGGGGGGVGAGSILATSWFMGGPKSKSKMKCMIPDEHIDRITTLVNELVDLDFFDEDSEQRIFDDMIRKIVSTLEEIMPEDYHLLVQHKHPLGGGLSKEHADEIESRAVKYVQCLLSFPYLDEADEERVIQFVVKIICQSMREDRTLSMLVDKNVAGGMIVDVLMKGAVRKLFNKEEKEKIIEDVVLSWCKIFPFLPASTLEFCAVKAIEWGAKHMEAALESSFQSFNEEMAARKGTIAPSDVQKHMAERERKVDKNKDYDEFHDCCEEDVEYALGYEECLIDHLERKFGDDLPDFGSYMSDRKKIMCHKLATLMVSHLSLAASFNHINFKLSLAMVYVRAEFAVFPSYE